MDLNIKGKTALVTGASAGLGLAVAQGLAAEGVRVAISSRSRFNIEAAAATIGGDAVPLVCDMADAAARDALIGQASNQLGPIDILVVNSGGPRSGPFESHDDQAFAAVIDQHLGSAIALTRAVLPSMRERRWGRILTITSSVAKQPPPGMILSNVARAAVASFAKTIASEVAADGITVNNLMPGATKTARTAELAGQMAERTGKSVDEIQSEMRAQIPAGRMGTVEEFAAAAAFLCSMQAGFITGVSLTIDGGASTPLF